MTISVFFLREQISYTNKRKIPYTHNHRQVSGEWLMFLTSLHQSVPVKIIILYYLTYYIILYIILYRVGYYFIIPSLSTSHFKSPILILRRCLLEVINNWTCDMSRKSSVVLNTTGLTFLIKSYCPTHRKVSEWIDTIEFEANLFN